MTSWDFAMYSYITLEAQGLVSVLLLVILRLVCLVLYGKHAKCANRRPSRLSQGDPSTAVRRTLRTPWG